MLAPGLRFRIAASGAKRFNCNDKIAREPIDVPDCRCHAGGRLGNRVETVRA